MNLSGAGGVDAGELYVANTQNNRVEEYTAAGEFVRAFGWDAVYSGQGNSNVNQQQSVTIKATGGTFTLTPTTATGNGRTTSESKVLTNVSVAQGSYHVGDAITGTAIPAGTTVAAVGSDTLTLSNAPTATSAFVVALTVTETTAPITFNAGPGALEAALTALPGIGAGNVAVGGGPGDETGTSPYLITFQGDLGGDELPKFTASATGLTGGAHTATIAVASPGGAYEICNAASTPQDRCKAGVSTGAAGALAEPQGVAVDQSTGNVYVTSQVNKRVDVFSAKGIFEGAFGWNVKATGGAEEPQFCTVATGCKAGVAKEAAGGFGGLTKSKLAVDPSSGNLYVPDSGNLRMDVFEADLNGADEVVGASFLRAFGWNVDLTGGAEAAQVCTTLTGCKKGTSGAGDGQFTTATPTSAAVDGAGDIYAVSANGSCSSTNPCRIQKFSDMGAFEETVGPSTGGAEACQTTWTAGAANFEAPTDVAVDPSDEHLFVVAKVSASSAQICEFGADGSLEGISPPSGSSLVGSGNSGLAAGTSGRIYYVTNPSVPNSVVYLLGPQPPASAKMISAETAGPGGGHFVGEVAAPAESGGKRFDTTWHFEYSTDQEEWTAVPIPDKDAGSEPERWVRVEEGADGLKPLTRYFVRLCATTSSPNCTASVRFTTQAQAPTVVTTYAEEVGRTEAILAAQVNPENSPTTYHFEWGSTESYGHRVPVFDRAIGSGEEAIVVKEPITGLVAEAPYHFRVVAENASGVTEGPDEEFITLNAASLPDHRGIELVSPADMGKQGMVKRLLAREIAYQAAEDGQGIVFPILNGTEDTTRGGDVRYQAERTSTGWRSFQLAPPSLIVRPEVQSAETSEVRYASKDLSCTLIESVNPLTADVPTVDREIGVTNLYRRDRDGSYTLLSNPIPSNPSYTSATKAYFVVAGASEDCERIYFATKYELIPGASGLYEWHDGSLRDAGILPDGTVAAGGALQEGSVGPGGEFGFQVATRLGSVSEDGSRFFFTATSDEGEDQGQKAVFAREGDSTVDISQPVTSTATLGAQYEAAATDGTRVFFTANYGLAPTSSGGTISSGERCRHVSLWEGNACDLYEYDSSRPLGERLTDLSADPNSADPKGAMVEGTVAVSPDGEDVYFAALGQLVPGRGNTYAENVTSGSEGANIYLTHGPHHELSYVATVSRRDLFGRGASNVGGSSGASAVLMRQAGEWNAEISADGSKLLFVSEEPVTGYQSGGVAELYLYSQATERVLCISCRRDDRPSVASPQSTPVPSTPAEREKQLYYPRAMDNDGSRIFFTIADPLAPGAQSDAENLYEWENGTVYLLNSEPLTVEKNGVSYPPGGTGLYATSASGDDLFFVSVRRLAPQDKDSVQSLYDARIDGGFPAEAAPPASCDALGEGACQGSPAPPPSGTSPVTPSFTGPSNPPPPKHKKKHHKRKHHKKKHQGKKGKARRANHDRRAGK